jgi:hypothetical protein
MRQLTLYCIGATLLALCPAASATTFTFDTAPFAGTNVLNIPGRQLVGGELFLPFFTANDIFSMDADVFGVDTSVQFANSTAANLPTGGVNVIVLEDFDNDANPLTPFGAGNAADLIANRITDHGAGFFVYFNQGLNLPRLVFSTDLSSSDSDLKVLARMLNLTGDEGRNAMPTFTARNFELTASGVPEPSSFLMMTGAGLIGACYILRRRRDPA